ncbi:hypothetical protein EJ07DRAFT_153677 [Lizonia empirigonia]|nr:hypothetical protein EJ07DRAFT_153677 [Lizonia empirigonia]
MLFKASLLFGLAVAVPTEQLDARRVNCKAVNFAVQALKISPGASKYCSNVLGIKPARKTQTVSTVKTITTTKVTQETVTETTTATATSTSLFCLAKRHGQPFKFAEPTDTARPKRTPAPPAHPLLLQDRTTSCAGAPIRGFACSLLTSACSCLSLPAAPSTQTCTTTHLTTTTLSSAAAPATSTATVTTTVVERRARDTQNDALNCGRCGVVCAGETAFCAFGRCVAPCGPGQDFEADESNCGSCGNVCPLGGEEVYVCEAGECVVGS